MSRSQFIAQFIDYLDEREQSATWAIDYHCKNLQDPGKALDANFQINRGQGELAALNEARQFASGTDQPSIERLVQTLEVSYLEAEREVGIQNQLRNDAYQSASWNGDKAPLDSATDRLNFVASRQEAIRWMLHKARELEQNADTPRR